MKIEKINDNRIKCTLSKSDLEARHISIKELASGSSKAQQLISEMIETAGKQFNFQVNNEPLVIEAAQLPDGEIHFYISKGGASPLLSHDEADKSTFTITTQDETLNSNIPMPTPTIEEAKEAINNFFDFARQQIFGGLETGKSKLVAGPVPTEDDKPTPIRKQPVIQPKEIKLPDVLSRAFLYPDMNRLNNTIATLKKVYDGNISVYENPNSYSYYLVIYGVPAFAEEFNKTCNLLTEYGSQLKLQCSKESYYREHYDIIYQGGIQGYEITK